MNIGIHKPELLQRFNAHIKNGQFQHADDLIEKALDALDEKSPTPEAPAKVPAKKSCGPARNFSELMEPLRGLFTDEEVDTLFSRNSSTSRPLDLA